MKSSMIILGSFLLGCLVGVCGEVNLDMHEMSMYVLYALMLQVGITIGCNKTVKSLVKNFRWRIILLPLATIVGSLLFSFIAALLLGRWSLSECMAVGSGLGYYSLSAVLITQFKEPVIGLQLATELGTIALLANIFREIIALSCGPFFRKYFGSLAPISVAGVSSTDVLLPTIARCSGSEMVPVAIFHGLLIELSVPLLVFFFCHI